MPSFRGRGRPDNRHNPSVRINERIRVPEVRVIGDDGEQLGVMTPRAALERARAQGLDLVEVAPNSQPPVCRIIDYGKFQYEQKKKAHEAKKKQTTITVKEIKFRPGTDDHDYEYRMQHARQWLGDGDKVRATIWFRGREMTHRELGYRILQRLTQELADIADVEQQAKMEGNQMFVIFAPKKQQVQAPPKPAAPKPESKPADDGAPKEQ